MGFSRQESWSGLPYPPPGDLPDPGTKLGSPTLQAYSLPPEPPGKPILVAIASLVALMVKNLPAMWETWVSIPGLGRSPGGGYGNPLQYFCLEISHGQRSLEGYCPYGHKELDLTEGT